MISLILIFGFLCRYPDDLRNIVQQCASDGSPYVYMLAKWLYEDNKDDDEDNNGACKICGHPLAQMPTSLAHVNNHIPGLVTLPANALMERAATQAAEECATAVTGENVRITFNFPSGNNKMLNQFIKHKNWN